MSITESGSAGPGQLDAAPITFERSPAGYRHWRLGIEGPVARLTMAVDPDGAAIGGYELKLNSYDIGVDIELADAIRRLRFEHPEVSCVVIDSALSGTFCAGANIRMLAAASHAHKVNFCKFTNETRLEMEDASEHSGLHFLAAVNGACSGGGYELAMACDHILLVDDRSSAVSLPELPLLGVLPGTGGLTRLTDKRGVRRDIADVFATRAEGAQGAEALAWGLVDELAPPSEFDAGVEARAAALAAASDRDPTAEPVHLEALNVTIEGSRADDRSTVRYRNVEAVLDRPGRTVEIEIRGPESPGDADWLLPTARELDDLLCHLRFNEPTLGTLLVRTVGDPASVTAADRVITAPITHAERETALLWRRTLSRLDLTARSIIAVVEPGSCFAGLLAELALAADRTYMLAGVFEDDDEPLPEATITLTAANLGPLPMANGLTRLASRFWARPGDLAAAEAAIGRPLVATEAAELGVVTITCDDLDWDDELRLAVEERASFSPDALTGMEANHRFTGPETMATKIFARLSAWQNWIFTRPNAVGPEGALQRFGTGTRPTYRPDRT